MLGMLAAIIGIYLFVGLQTLLNRTALPGGDLPATQVAGIATSSAPASTSVPTALPTGDLPTPTDLPTSAPPPTATDEPTKVPIILQPTSLPTDQPTAPPTRAPVASATASTAPKPTAVVKPTAAPKPQPTAVVKPTAAPKPPTAVPPTAVPPLPTAAPANVSIKPVTLYFTDPTGSLLVPVRRNTRVTDNRIAAAAISELIAGPRNGLGRMVSSEANLLDLRIEGNRAIVNFDRDPGGVESILFTLTEFPSISSVQVQVNGANLGEARARPVLNPLNPQKLAVDYRATEFLPLYFPSASSGYDIRIIRMVPKTKQTAEATIRVLLEGPGVYDGIVRRVIPAETQLRGIKLNGDVVLVDFTQPFAEAADLNAAMRTVVESLTTLKTVSGVQFLVEGQAFADGKIFRRPVINQE
jgi:spore germination protein GerM